MHAYHGHRIHGTERVQCIRRGGYIALGRCAAQPVIGNTRLGIWICDSNGIDCLMQRPRIGFPIKLDSRERYFCIHVRRLNGQRAIQHGDFFSIVLENSVTIPG